MATRTGAGNPVQKAASKSSLLRSFIPVSPSIEPSAEADESIPVVVNAEKYWFQARHDTQQLQFGQGLGFSEVYFGPRKGQSYLVKWRQIDLTTI